MKLRPGNKKNHSNNYNNRIKSAPQNAVIAELDRLREDLNASEEKYRATFEAASIAIISVDKEGVLLDYNRAAAELFGVGRSEMLGKSGVGMIARESLPEYAAGMKKVVEKGFSYNGRYRMKKKSGGVIDVIISSTAIKDKSGRFLRTISVIEDVTDRLFMEEVLKESEEKYRMIFNSSDDAIMVHAPEKDGTPGRFIAVNKVACDRLGYTREEFLKLTPADIHASNDKAVVRESILRVLKEGHVKFETFHRAKNGALIPVEITANSFDLRGKTTVVVSAREISGRKAAERQLKEQNKYKELRAQIWKLAADKEIGEDNLVRGLIDRLGAALDLSRVVYSRLDNEKLYTFYEWKSAGTKGTSMGLSIPARIARVINFDRQMTADIDTATRLVPGVFRGMIRALLSSISKRSGDMESLITPCLLDGKLEGLIFCVSEGAPIREWPDEKKQLVSETATIIASAIADRRKDKLLKQQNAYNELRAEIWKLAADKNIRREDLISGLISRIGTVLNTERVAYSSIKGDNLSAEFEWKGEGAKGSSIGVKLPLAIFNRFKIDRQKVLNKENIFGLLPGGQHGLFRRVIALLMKATDSEIKEALSTMIYVDGRKFAAITCVYGRNGMWTDEKKQLVLEAALIVERMLEQRKRDAELRESESKYRTLFDSSMDAVIVHQPLPGHRPGPIIAVNRIAIERFGYTEKEFLKLNLKDINAPEARQNPVKATKNIFREGRVTLETVHITKTGRRIPTEVSAVLINYGGKPTVVANSRDISERNRLEEKEKKQAEMEKVRSELWKAASETGVDEENLIQMLLAKIGPVIGAERVSYGAPEAGKFVITHEWKTAKLRRFRGFSFPLEMFEKYKMEKQSVVTITALLKDMPPALRIMLTPILKVISGRYGDKPSLMTPYFISGKREGIIICSPAGSKTQWEPEEEQLVSEAAQILSRAFSSRRAEEKLAENEKLYRELFTNAYDGIIVQEMGAKPGAGVVSKVLDYNDALCKILDLKKDGYEGLTINDLFDMETLMQMRKTMKEMAPGSVSEGIYDMKTKKGRKIKAEIRTRIFDFGASKIMLSVVRDITLKLQGDEALKESEEQFRTAFKTSPDSININRLSDGMFVDINEGFSRIMGYSKKDVEGKTSLQINLWNNPEDRRRLLAGLKKHGFVDNLQAVFRSKNGDLKSGLMSARIIMIKGEKHIISITRDISDRIKAEQEVKESEEKFRTAFMTSPDAITINRVSDGMFLEVNDGFTRITGYTREDTKGKTSNQINIWERPGDRMRIMEGIKKQGFVENLEGRIRLKNGEFRNALLSAKLIMIKGEPYTMSISRDITDMIKATAALAESESKLRGILKAAPVGVGIMTNRIVSWTNETLREMLGYSEQELEGMPTRNLYLSREEYARVGELERAGVETAGLARVETRWKTKKGRPLDIYLSAAFVVPGDFSRGLVFTVMDISGLKKAQESLRVSEEKYKNVISQTGQLVYDYAVNSGVVEWSGAVHSLTGFTDEEFNREVSIDVWAGMIHPDDREKALGLLYEAQESCKKHYAEYRFRKKDGSYFDVLDEGICIPDEDNRATRMLGVLKDITDIKRAENEIRESEEKFRIFSEQSEMGITMISGNDMIYYNTAFLRIHELSDGDMRDFHRKDLIIMVHPEDSAALTAAMRRDEEAGVTLKRYAFRIYTRSRKLKYLDIYSRRLSYHGKEVDFMTIVDVTDVKEAEAALKESEEKFRTISEQSLIGIGIVQGGAIKYFNDAFAAIAGFTREEIEAWNPMKYFELIHPEDIAMVREQSGKKETGDPTAVVHYPIRFIDKKGSLKWVDNYSNTIEFMGKPAVIFAQADITPMKNAQAYLERAVKDLERSNAELERFAYVASHDLQEPLRMISSYVQLLERRYKDKLDPDANDFINYAVDGAARMQKLIKDLLAYSRLGTIEKQLVKLDTSAILEKVKENLAGAISEKNALITGSNLPKIIADESQTLQLFQNLISNSLKFSAKDRQCGIDISAVKKGKEWEFCFKDNGIGIDRQYFEKIFVVFQRLHAATEYPGTGIGLAICKRIVENHGGRIWVESVEGGGASFYFTLPDRET